MSEEVKLIARVEATQRRFEKQMGAIARSADKNFGRMQHSGKAYERQMHRIAGSVKNAFVGAFAGLAVGRLVGDIFSVNKEFQDLKSSLEVATGSIDKGAAAFKDIRKFAASTPYAVKGLTDSFVLLKNLGINPTMKRMRAFGNISSALNKDFKQMAEAVADAAVGEFERLKEFGIKAKQQGDKVTLIFQGVAKTIGNNAQDITKYLTQLGEAKFGDAMSKRMKNLSGLASNLGDKLDNLYLTIGDAGATGVFAAAIQVASTAVDFFANNINLLEGVLAGVAVVIAGALVPSIKAMTLALSVNPFGLMILAAGTLVGVIVSVRNSMGEAEALAYSLSNADVNLARTTNIATMAQDGLTKALRQRGREQAALSISDAAANKLSADVHLSKKTALVDEHNNVRISPYASPDPQRKAMGRALQRDQDIANSMVKKAVLQRKKALENYQKIENAEIIDNTTKGGGAGGVVAGGVAAVVKNKVNQMTQMLRAVETPLETLNREKHEFLQKLDLNDQSDAILYQKLVAKAKERYDAAIAKPDTGSGGGSLKVSNLGLGDNEAKSLIEKYGSAADKARVAVLAYGVELGKINELLGKGKIDQETYNNAVESVKSVYEQAKAAAADYGAVVGTIMDGVKGTLKSVFSQIFKDGKITMKSLADMVNDMMGRIFDKLSGLAIDGIFSAMGFSGGGGVGKFADGGMVQHLAAGGGVFGAGTGRSDSIPAMLSDGEFVVNANATGRHRALLEQINSGNKIAFANQNSQNQNININAQPIVNFNISITNAPPNMRVTEHEQGVDIDFIEAIENGLSERARNGDSNLLHNLVSNG